MRVHFLGHASFLLTTRRGLRVLLDPCRPDALGGRVRAASLASAPDLIAVTHYHEDHGWIGAVPGAAPVVDRSCRRRGVDFLAITAAHDAEGGSRMGLTRSFVVSADGLRVLHVGDLANFDERWLAEVGPVDLALVPVGGVYTLPPPRAAELAQALAARWVVPMHYRSDDVALDMADRQPFLDACAPLGLLARPEPNPLELTPQLAPGVLLLEPPPPETRV